MALWGLAPKPLVVLPLNAANLEAEGASVGPRELPLSDSKLVVDAMRAYRAYNGGGCRSLGGGAGPAPPIVEDKAAIAGEDGRLIAGVDVGAGTGGSGSWLGTSTWIKSSSLPDFRLRNFIQRNALHQGNGWV